MISVGKVLLNRQAMSSLSTSCTVARLAILHLIIFAIVTSIAIYLFAVLHTYSKPVEACTTMPISAAHGWVYFQSLLLVTLAALPGGLISRVRPRLGSAIGMAAVTIAAVAFVLDVVAFNAVRERLLSDTTAKVLWVLMPGLISNINLAMVSVVLASLAVAIAFFITAFYGSAALARQIVHDERQSSPKHLVALSLFVLIGLAAVPLYRGRVTIDEMRMSSDRHPLCLTGTIGHVNQGVPTPTGAFAVTGAIRALGAGDRISQIELEYPRILASTRASTRAGDSPPDVLLVVIESLRREVIQKDVTPNLYALANRGIWAKNHFSTSNATNMGMFSAVYGLEPVWFDRGVEWKPAMNELFSQANYQLGFFGGSEHWDTFRMDTFINPELYDQFFISPVNWTESDLSMRDKTLAFFSADEADGQPRRPRLAVLYLYSTHFDYYSEPEDQLNQPAAKGQLTAAYGPASRDEIWNRYLNSTRFIDRILGPLLTEDRVVAVIGDHGESFLEDECRLHGIRISEFQNATPAIIAGPGIPARQLSKLTSHTDILPSLLDAAGISIEGGEVLEGMSMLDPDLPSNRLMTTRNYMKPEIAILGSWTGKTATPWGHRAYFSIDQWQASPANPIDRYGTAFEPQDNTEHTSTDEIFHQWFELRFGKQELINNSDLVPSLLLYLTNNRREVVLEALKQSIKIDPLNFPSLLPSVAELSRNTDDEIRLTAQAVWLEMQRQVKHSRKQTNAQ
jgi:membrane-anchored protein YejM (alkaline phosphatase superfamily)